MALELNDPALIKERMEQATRKYGIEFAAGCVEQDAKLFAAGRYEDEGLVVSEADLERLAELTEPNLPVPIRIEHVEGPLHLGVLAHVYCKGSELFGRLVFTKPAWDLVKLSGAARLSIALKRDLSDIAEVSLVRNPRVAGAVIFSVEPKSSSRTAEEVKLARWRTEWERKIARLEATVRAMASDDQGR